MNAEHSRYHVTRPEVSFNLLQHSLATAYVRTRPSYVGVDSADKKPLVDLLYNDRYLNTNEIH